MCIQFVCHRSIGAGALLALLCLAASSDANAQNLTPPPSFVIGSFTLNWKNKTPLNGGAKIEEERINFSDIRFDFQGTTGAIATFKATAGSCQLDYSYQDNHRAANGCEIAEEGTATKTESMSPTSSVTLHLNWDRRQGTFKLNLVSHGMAGPGTRTETCPCKPPLSFSKPVGYFLSHYDVNGSSVYVSEDGVVFNLSTNTSGPNGDLRTSGQLNGGIPRVSISQTRLEFGRAPASYVMPDGERVKRSFFITNQGYGLLEGEVAHMTGPFTVFSVGDVRGNRKFRLQSGISVEVVVAFTPSPIHLKDFLTALMGDLYVTHNVPSTPNMRVNLVGTAETPRPIVYRLEQLIAKDQDPSRPDDLVIRYHLKSSTGYVEDLANIDNYEEIQTSFPPSPWRPFYTSFTVPMPIRFLRDDKGNFIGASFKDGNGPERNYILDPKFWQWDVPFNTWTRYQQFLWKAPWSKGAGTKTEGVEGTGIIRTIFFRDGWWQRIEKFNFNVEVPAIR